MAVGLGAALEGQAPGAPPRGASRFDAGRFTILAYPAEHRLARALLETAQSNDSFPGLPRPQRRVIIALAPDAERFRSWVGAGAPEWGAAIAFPASHRIVLRGRDPGVETGDHRITLRHELAHLALYEALGSRAPRWFDEGYASFAAGEWGRDEILRTSLGLVWRGVPSFRALDSSFYRGSEEAQRGYALAHRAVAELSALDPNRGLTLLFRYWRAEGSFDAALRLGYGISEVGFEGYFQRRIRRQFGVLALGADLSVLSVVLVLVLGPLWWQRRRRQRARFETMRQADLAQEARERESALAELLAGAPPPSDEERIKDA